MTGRAFSGTCRRCSGLAGAHCPGGNRGGPTILCGRWGRLRWQAVGKRLGKHRKCWAGIWGSGLARRPAIPQSDCRNAAASPCESVAANLLLRTGRDMGEPVSETAYQCGIRGQKAAGSGLSSAIPVLQSPGSGRLTVGVGDTPGRHARPSRSHRLINRREREGSSREGKRKSHRGAQRGAHH